MTNGDNSFHLMNNNNNVSSMAFAFSPVVIIDPNHHPSSSSVAALSPSQRWASAPVPVPGRRMHAFVDRRRQHPWYTTITTNRRSPARCCADNTATTTATTTTTLTKTKTSVLVIGEDTELGKAMVNEFGFAIALSTVSVSGTTTSEHKHKQIVLDTADRAATYDALQALCLSDGDGDSDDDAVSTGTKWVVIVCLPTAVDAANNNNNSSSNTSNNNTDDDNDEKTSFLPRAKNVIDACAKLLITPPSSSSSSEPTSAISRFILLTSLGAGDSELSIPKQVQQALRPQLLDMTDAEAYLRAHVPATSMPWTIVRPAPVDDHVTDSRRRKLADTAVTLQTACYGTVSSAQVAWAVARVAASKGGDMEKNVVGKTVHVVDRTQVLITAPYVRPLEKWESLPFDEIDLGQ